MPRLVLTAPAGLGGPDSYLENQTGDLIVAADGAEFDPADDVFLLCSATGTSSVTVDSVADANGREASSTQETHSFTSGDFFTLGPYPAPGWAQSDGKVHLDVANDNALRVKLIRGLRPILQP